MSVDSGDLFNKLYTKFDLEAQDIFKRETLTNRLTESGQPRVALRNLVMPLIKTADNQLDPQNQVKLCASFAVDFAAAGEYALALECFQAGVLRADGIKDEVGSIRHRVESMQSVVKTTVSILEQSKQGCIAPMAVSKLQVCLQELRKALEEDFTMSTTNQEELAWQILNSCKLVLEVGQPLIWFNCGKYVAETLVFAATAMEAVINLCTVRHFKFRMKLYSAAFYGVLTMGSLEEADGVYEHAARQARELRAREEIDPPVPEESLRAMEEADLSIAVMRVVLDFWRDPDSLNLASAHLEKYYKPKAALPHPQSFADRCVTECIRVHLLASGNTNEPFRKRSSCILKAAVKAFETYKVDESREPGAELSAANQAVAEQFSTQSLLEIAILALFEVSEGVVVDDLLSKVWHIAQDGQQLRSSDAVEPLPKNVVNTSDKEAADNLLLLQRISKLVGLEPLAPKRLLLLSDIVVQLEGLIYSDIAYRRKAFLKRVSVFLWTRFVYPSVQKALSSFESTLSLGLIEEVTPAVCIAVRALDAVELDDAVLLGTMAQLAGNLLWITGDHRGCISLLREAAESLDVFRASRVDLDLHMPEDVRDVYGVQRAAFTTRSDEQDWFQSTKRLGAHAFAGFGIFGLSSSADRSDQAVAEIQAELTSLYFRCELEYAVEAHLSKLAIKNATVKFNTIKAKEQARLDRTNIKITAKVTVATTKTKTHAATLPMFSPDDIDCEKLAIVTSLRSYCAKNCYTGCLLLLEMSRVDSSEERRFEYLRQAFALIEEAEGREEMLKESFKQLIVMTHASRTFPVVLARSHRYIYAAPAGCRKLKASYYRVFAKEKGSGTDVSIYNDDLAGCEVRVPVSALSSLKSSVVRIGPLRRGELYMLGCVAFNVEDKPLGHVSPTSPIVEAVNPLPTVLLWSLLNQTAGEVLTPQRISREAALRVCDRYFLVTPSVAPVVVGKGINLFLYTEPSLCTLAIQQSTPLMLQQFVQSFLSYELLNAAKRTIPDIVNWAMRKPTQVSEMVSLQRTALVTAVAVALGNHDLTLQCVKIGYEQVLALLRFDIVHIAFNLQNPLTVLVLAMQSIAKRNWRMLEHKLYTKLLGSLVKVSALNRSISPVIGVLNQFYPEALDKELVGSSLPASELLAEYLHLHAVVREHIAVGHLTAFQQQFAALHVPLTLDAFNAGEKSEVGYLWKMSEAQRRQKLAGGAVDFVTPSDKPTPEKEQLEGWLIKDRPEAMSDLLNTLVLMGRELISQDKAPLWHKLLAKVPLYAEYLSPDVQTSHRKWDLQLLLPVSVLKDAPVAAPPAGKKAPPAKGKAAEVPEVPAEDPCKVPDRFLTTSPEEVHRQWMAVARLLYTSASACCDPSILAFNAFPSSTSGPNIFVDPASAPLDIAIPEPAAAASTLHGAVFQAGEYLKYLGASIDFFCAANAHSAAVMAAVKLWSFISSQWQDPAQFAQAHVSSASSLHHTAWALVRLLETMSQFPVDNIVGELEAPAGGIDLDTSLHSTELVASGTDLKCSLTPREVKESMLVVRELAVFLLKVKWLLKDFGEVVKIGTKVFGVLATNCPEFTKVFGDQCMPLIVHSQEMLVSHATDVRNGKQKDLDDFILAYEEAQKKKRKKKLRIASTEKTDEELAFDAECAVFQSKIDEARAALDRCETDLLSVKAQKARFDSMYSTGSQLLDKVRLSASKLLQDLRCEYGQDVDLRSLATNETVTTKLAVVLKQFKQTVSFLREHKDLLVLVEALKEQGDLLLMFGRIPDCRNAWNDSVDGLFNTIDSCANWTTVCAAAIDSPDPELLSGILPVIVALGKLSKFCVSGDLDAKSNYCRMAAELCRLPFFESYGHPQTTAGFAAYVCMDLCGVQALSLCSDALTAQGLSVALEEVLSVLLAERQYVVSLPVVVLLEHLYSVYLRNSSLWLSARLVRIRALVGSRHFAEAASMIASIKPTVSSMQGFSDPLRRSTSAETATLPSFETSSNGLNFFGMAPFFNNCTPDDDKSNAKALDWIKAFPADFESFAKPFQLLLPMTDEQRAAAAAAAAKAEAEAAELAKKSKGKKPAAAEAEPAVQENSVPVFDEVQIANVYSTCSHLLLELAMLDGQSTAKHSAALVKLGASGSELLSKAITILYSKATLETLRSPAWISLNGACQMLFCRYKLFRRKLKECRAALLKFVDFMKSSVFSDLSGDARYSLCQLWFAAHDMLITVASRQSRQSDGIAMASQSATEASMLYCGHWLRASLFQRASMELKLGNVQKALADVDACLGLFEVNRVEDLLLIRSLSLKATILREKALYATKPVNAANAFVECITLLRSAKTVCEKLAMFNGAFTSDSNVVYFRSDTAVLNHHKISPILNNLTTRHHNEPELTLKARLDAKKLDHVGIAVPESGPYSVNPVRDDELRPGPVDFSETVYSLSEFANIYLPEVRALVTASCALCSVLEDYRVSGAVDQLKPREDVDPAAFQLEQVLREEEFLGESALKLMRQSIYTPPSSRIAILNVIGKVRVALATIKGTDLLTLSSARLTLAPAVENSEVITETLFDPFKAALDIAVKSMHPWDLIRTLCVQMVEAYGDSSLDFGEENDHRHKNAVTYLVGAVRAGVQYGQVTKNANGLSDDPTFSATPASEELLSLMVNTTSSSATVVAKPEAEAAPAAAAGKGAAKPAKGAPAAAPAGPSGRDALFLLSSVLRETDPLWRDSHEQELSGDLHCLLKKTYPLYSQRCSSDKAPNPSEAASVAPGCSSTLWMPTKTPADFADSVAKASNGLDYAKTGLYSHVAVFFLLGDKKAPAPPPDPKAKAPPAGAPAAVAASVKPVLTRLVLSKVDVVYLEKRLRDLRDRYIDADTKKFPKTFRRCNEELGEVLCLLVGLLKTGMIILKKEEEGENSVENGGAEAVPRSKCTYSLAENTPPGSYTLTLNLTTNGKATATVVVPISESFVLSLATLFSCDRDTDSLADNDALAVIRAALGYGER